MARARPPETRPKFWLWWRLIAALLVVYALYTAWLGGAYRSVDPFVAGTCRSIDAPAGPEDILILPGRDMALVSAQDRRQRTEPGGLWLYDLRAGGQPFNRLAVPAGMPLHPHGISAIEGPDGHLYVQVINHRGDAQHTVEIFILEGANLRHVSTIRSDLFVSPNGIVATAPDSFYLTNDRGSGPRWMHAVENLLQLTRSNVVQFDGRTARVAAEDIAFANGIALSAEGDAVVVGSTLWRMLLAYQRDPMNGMLKRTGSLAMPGGVDNLRPDAEGNLWAAVHPNAFAFIGHARDPAKESPSQIVRISRDERGATRLQQAFADPGQLLPGASVAAYRNGRLLIGAVFASRILDCVIDPAQLRDII